MKFKVEEYTWHHGCGCCTDWGVNVYVDGKLFVSVSDKEAAYEYILKDILKIDIEETSDYMDNTFPEDD
jgi:hypothetical protein